MSLCNGKLFLNLFLKQQNVTVTVCRYLSLTPTLHSMYPRTYVEPLVDREGLSQPLDELDERRHRPIKAARSEQTTLFYHDTLIQKFTNMLMSDGKKKEARDVMDKTLANIKRTQLKKYHRIKSEEEREKIELDPVKIFHQAYENCKPVLFIKPVIRAGFRYKVPVPCEGNTQSFKSLKTLITAAREKRIRKPMHIKLSEELIQASQNQGLAIQKKRDLHRLCENNRAYAQFRW